MQDAKPDRSPRAPEAETLSCPRPCVSARSHPPAQEALRYRMSSCACTRPLPTLEDGHGIDRNRNPTVARGRRQHRAQVSSIKGQRAGLETGSLHGTAVPGMPGTAAPRRSGAAGGHRRVLRRVSARRSVANPHGLADRPQPLAGPACRHGPGPICRLRSIYRGSGSSAGRMSAAMLAATRSADSRTDSRARCV